MEKNVIIPHLFRTEYGKMVAVLCKLFGIAHIETAEDIVSETFLQATELWGQRGLPSNPVGWLYTVAKNKTKDYCKRNAVFARKIAALHYSAEKTESLEIDLTDRNIKDSQLAMIFAVCNPCIAVEAQISLSLNLLCGFGAEEIADAFLTNKEVVYKRLARAREKLRQAKIVIEQPGIQAINERLPAVLKTLYLLFNEGYYSSSQNTQLRRDLCLEAMRMNYMLIENTLTNTPAANALLSLMCFHSSRFEARTGQQGEMILYQDQDPACWNQELIGKGEFYLNRSSTGKALSNYHLEAAIAYWHTHKEDSAEKWEHILQLYNKLLQLQYSTVAALNRTFALAKANGKEAAIEAAERLQLNNNYLYHMLLGHLYTGVNSEKALDYFNRALRLAHSNPVRAAIHKNIAYLTAYNPLPGQPAT
jgi:RNA polymerase sigma factor (sigma-70 family)